MKYAISAVDYHFHFQPWGAGGPGWGCSFTASGRFASAQTLSVASCAYWLCLKRVDEEFAIRLDSNVPKRSRRFSSAFPENFSFFYLPAVTRTNEKLRWRGNADECHNRGTPRIRFVSGTISKNRISSQFFNRRGMILPGAVLSFIF